MSNNQRSSGFLAIRFTLAAIMVGVFFGLSTIGTGAQRASLTDREGSRDTRGTITRSDAPSVSTSIVINEIYGGAGCGTAGCSTFQNDFIELKNISTTAINITGWSVQYTSATGPTTAYAVTPLSGAIRPGDTFLIAEAFGANGVSPLPTPNNTGTITMSATTGKVALVNNSTPLGIGCPTGATIIDYVGYGPTASCFEGTGPAPVLTTTTSNARNVAGADTDQNATDYTANAPTPQAALQSTAAGVSVSGRVTTAEGRGITNARITVTGNSLAQPISVITGRRGFYNFEDLQSGETYIVTVGSRRFTFSSPSRVLSLVDNITDEDFVADPMQ